MSGTATRSAASCTRSTAAPGRQPAGLGDRTENAETRGDGAIAPGIVKLLLDGQQRITSLYGIIRGRPPRFFDGNAQAFTGLQFHLDDEAFEFYPPLKMKDDPLWINVTELMQQGVGPAITRLDGPARATPKLNAYVNRLAAIDASRTSTSTSRRSRARTRRSTSSSTSSTGSTAAAPSSPRATWRWPRSAPSGPRPATR